MKKLLGFALVFGVLLAVMPASAGTVPLAFLGPEGGSLGGVNTYPYGFSINGSGDYQLICDTFNREISNGETWTANVMNMSSLTPGNVGNLFFGDVNGGGDGAIQYYLASALLFEDARNNPNNASYDNWAIWYMLDPNAVTGSSGWGSVDQGKIKDYAQNAITAASQDTPSQFSDVVIYTPTNTGTTGPQEFLGYDTPGGTTPEPSSLALFGSGVLGIAGMLRRKMKA